MLMVLCASLLLNTKASAQEIELFSKGDADVVFSMSKAQWNRNVVAIDQSGDGLLKGEPTYGFTLVTTNPTGYLAVAPRYEKDEKPSFISVTIGYKKEIAGLITNKAFNDALTLAKSHLLPAYEIDGEMDTIPGGVYTKFMYFGIYESKQNQ